MKIWWNCLTAGHLVEVPFKIFNLVCCLVIPCYYRELIGFGTIGFHSQFQIISPCGKMRKYISYFIMQEKDNTNQNRVFCWSFVYKEVNNSLVLSKGLDPFNQNFWEFWCKTEGIGSVQMKKFQKSGSTFEVDHFSQLDCYDQKWLFHLTFLTHSWSQYLTVCYLPSVLLVHPCMCAVTTIS